MKRIVSIAVIFMLAAVIAFPFFGMDTVARAEGATYENGTYNAKCDITVYAMIGRTEKALFTIPTTYYFDIIDFVDDVYYITYNGSTEDEGYYIKPEELTGSSMALTDKDEAYEKTPFTVDLSLTADTTFEKQLKNNFTSVNITVTETNTIKYIGAGKNPNYPDCAYVYVNNADYGYIPVAALKVKGTETTLADYLATADLHPNYRPVVITESDNKDKTVDNAKLTRILLIVGIVVPALVIMLLLFKPSKKSRYNYDRNRSYDAGNSPYDRPRSRYRDDYYDDYERPAPPRNRYRDEYEDDYYDRRDDRRDGRRY